MDQKLQRTSKLQKKPSALKREHPESSTSKHEISSIFSTFVGHFCPPVFCLQLSKENIQNPALQNMKFLQFFLLLWVIFALLDPDLDSEYGSTDPFRIRIRKPGQYYRLKTAKEKAVRRTSIVNTCDLRRPEGRRRLRPPFLRSREHGTPLWNRSSPLQLKKNIVKYLPVHNLLCVYYDITM